MASFLSLASLLVLAAVAGQARDLSQAAPPVRVTTTPPATNAATSAACKTVYQVISDNPDLSTLKAAVDAAGMQGKDVFFNDTRHLHYLR